MHDNETQTGPETDSRKRGQSRVFPIRLYAQDQANLQTVYDWLEFSGEYIPEVTRQYAVRWALWCIAKQIREGGPRQ